MKKIILKLLILKFIALSQGNLRISEIMYNPDTLEYYCEFVEIYNCSSSPVSLEKLSLSVNGVKDSLIIHNNLSTLLPGQFAIVLDRGYIEKGINIYDLDTAKIPILLPVDNAFGRSGLPNSEECTIGLIRNHSLMDSVYYQPSGEEGYSLEKINLCGENSSDNWGYSIRWRGTPGMPNSLSPRMTDIKLDSVYSANSDILKIRISNVGLTPFNKSIPITMNVFSADSGYYQSKQVTISIELNPGEENEYSVTFSEHPLGRYFIGVELESFDQNNMNDNWNGEIDFGIPRNAFVISEVMVQSDITNEWMELFNRTDNYISLADLRICDSKDTTVIVKGMIEPNSFLLVCRDDESKLYFELLGKKASVIPSWLTLNNDADQIKFMTTQYTIDSMQYDFSIRGLDYRKGISLEKVQLNRDGWDLWNWGYSTDPQGHTAGDRNSLAYESFPLNESVTFDPNPFSPDGDGFEDVCFMSFHFPFSLMNLDIRIFSLDGSNRNQYYFKDVPGKYLFVFDGKDANGSVLKIGAYVVCIEATDIRTGQQRKVKKILVSARK